MTSEFKKLQKDVCDTEVEDIDLSKFCPTCIPDPDYIHPNWWETKQPYLNKKTCEYSTIVTINDEGQIFKHSTISSDDRPFQDILDSYKKNGINFLFNFFGKKKVTEIDGRPVEDYVEAKDYHFYSFADSVMVVLIVFPANVFNAIENEVAIQVSADFNIEKLIVRPPDFFGAMKKLKSTLRVFSKFQAFEYQLTNNKYVFKNNNEPLYLKFYPARITKFLDRLEKLLQSNDFQFGAFTNPLQRAFELEMTFELSNELQILRLKGIRAKKSFQKFKKLKKGLKRFLKEFEDDYTLMGMILNIKTLDLRINARRTPSWEEFINEFIFPPVKLSIKKPDTFNLGLPNLRNHLSKVDDLIFDDLISFRDAFVYNLNQSSKFNLQKLNEMPQGLDGFDFRFGEISVKFAENRKRVKTKRPTCVNDLLSTWTENGEEFLSEIVQRLHPCKLKDITATVVLCIIGNVEMETAFKAIIKSTFKGLTPEGLNIILQKVPESVRLAVGKYVLETIGSAPEPWSPEFQTLKSQQQATVGPYLADLPRSNVENSLGFSRINPENNGALSALDLVNGAIQLGKETEIYAVYEEALLKFASTAEILTAIENLPGIDLLTKFLGNNKFPTSHFIYPPIDSFLNSITFDPCGKQDLSLKMPRINFKIEFGGWDWLKELGRVFVTALKLTIKQILQALLAKISSKLTIELPTLGDLTCQGLRQDGMNPFSDILTDSGDMGKLLADAINTDAINPQSLVDPNSAVQAIMEKTGLVDENSRSRTVAEEFQVGIPEELNVSSPYSVFDDNLTTIPTEDITISRESLPFIELTKAISVAATKNEIIRAVTMPESEQSSDFFTNMANTLPAAVPEFSSSLNTEDKVRDFFLKVGSQLTTDQKSFLQDQIRPDGDSLPLEETICLTEEQYSDWASERENVFQTNGLDPEVAAEFVAKQNDRIKSDLDDFLEIFNNGPENLLQKAIDDALSEEDPCVNPNALLNLSSNNIVQDVINRSNVLFFERLERAFIDDTVEWNFFERLVDSPGILSLILADKKGFTLNYHNVVNGSPILKFFLPDPGEKPSTVSIQLYNYIQSTKHNYSNRKIDLKYSNEINDDPFELSLKIGDDVKTPFYSVLLDSNLSYHRFSVLNDQQLRFREKSKTEIIKNFYKNKYKFTMTDKQISDVYDSINSILYNDHFKRLFSNDSEPSQGFVYSTPEEEITKEDLKYVSPDGSDYSFTEEEAVLGRSSTSNPRVIFLDPSQNGGTYNKPKYFVKPQERAGWMKVSKFFLPDTEKEGDPLTFLDIPDLAKIINNVSNTTEPNPKLEQDPDTIIEVPFDKIASPPSLGMLEGCVIATVRTYIADFLIRSMPLLINCKFDSNNFDDCMINFIIELMQQNFLEQNTSPTSPYSGYVYWLLFLEQTVQAFDRRYGSLIEPINQSRESGLSRQQQEQESELSRYNFDILKIRAAQDNYKGDDGLIFSLLRQDTTWRLTDPIESVSIANKIDSLEGQIDRYKNAVNNSTLGDLKDFNTKLSELEEELEVEKENQQIYSLKKLFGDNVLRGSLIVAFGKDYWSSLGLLKSEFNDSIIETPFAATDEQFGFSISRLFNVDFQSINLMDANFASKIFTIQSVEENCKSVLRYFVREQMKFHLDKLNKFVTPSINNTSRYLFSNNSIDIPKPKLGQVGESFGNIYSCVHNPSQENPLEKMNLTKDQIQNIKQNGSFYFEKFLRVEDKPGTNFAKRPELLKGVVNPAKFKQYLVSIQNTIDSSMPISNYFGDARIDNFAELQGSIGIKFGVRLCFVPPENFTMSGGDFDKIRSTEKLFNLKMAEIDGGSFPSSRKIIPLCSYEQDLSDESVDFYINTADDNFGQDVSCYIDQLFLSDEYDIIFNYIFNIKKIPSIAAVYSYGSFLSALGIDGSEREKSDEADLNTNNISKIFNDSKKELRNLFMDAYIRKDFYEPDDKTSSKKSVKDKNNLLQTTLNAVAFSDNVPWFSKINRSLNNPFVDGILGGNKFSKVVKDLEE